MRPTEGKTSWSRVSTQSHRVVSHQTLFIWIKWNCYNNLIASKCPTLHDLPDTENNWMMVFLSVRWTSWDGCEHTNRMLDCLQISSLMCISRYLLLIPSSLCFWSLKFTCERLQNDCKQYEDMTRQQENTWNTSWGITPDNVRLLIIIRIWDQNISEDFTASSCLVLLLSYCYCIFKYF